MEQPHICTFRIITDDDTEIRELHALGIDYEIKGGKPVKSDYEMTLTKDQAKAIRAHSAVVKFTQLSLRPPTPRHKPNPLKPLKSELLARKNHRKKAAKKKK